MSAYTTETERWAAVICRDHRADQLFWYGVTTTGIFCKPGCPSRAPKPENIRYFDRLEDAESAGFRSCKRCKPEMPR